jgi:hypothetical protein
MLDEKKAPTGDVGALSAGLDSAQKQELLRVHEASCL